MIEVSVKKANLCFRVCLMDIFNDMDKRTYANYDEADVFTMQAVGGLMCHYSDKSPFSHGSKKEGAYFFELTESKH